MTEPVLAHLDEVWSSIEELCSTLTPAEWRMPTALEGWSVQDNLSHLCGIESKLLGRQQPPALKQPWPPHVRNELAAVNEAQVEARRTMAPEDVLTEFLELTAERLKVLAELTPQEWGADAQGVFGTGPLREVLAIRVIDCFYHEQDIRRATRRPMTLDVPAARFVVERMISMMPMIVAKRAGVNDGATVVIDVTGPVAAQSAIKVDAGRGTVIEQAPKSPTTLMRMDTETFLLACGGRETAEALSKRIIVDGNATFANRILESMIITP